VLVYFKHQNHITSMAVILANLRSLTTTPRKSVEHVNIVWFENLKLCIIEDVKEDNRRKDCYNYDLADCICIQQQNKHDAHAVIEHFGLVPSVPSSVINSFK